MFSLHSDVFAFCQAVSTDKTVVILGIAGVCLNFFGPFFFLIGCYNLLVAVCLLTVAEYAGQHVGTAYLKWNKPGNSHND